MNVCAVSVAAVLLIASVAWGQEAAETETAPTPATTPATVAQPAAQPSEAPAHTPAAGHTGETAAAHANDPAPHPALPDRSETWPGPVVIIILSMFLAAAIVGPIVRANTPEEVPPAHSHDEPPGASHHHGKSGTLNPEPDHGHASEHH